MTGLRRAAGILVLAVLALPSCGSDGGPSAPVGRQFIEVDGERIPASQFVAAVQGLCTVIAFAGTDSQAAEDTFDDQVHASLHDIGAAVDDVDRPAAASLLKAKNRVEADFKGGTVSQDNLRELLDATHAALRTLSVSAPECPAS
jgi:hypothetical protein